MLRLNYFELSQLLNTLTFASGVLTAHRESDPTPEDTKEMIAYLSGTLLHCCEYLEAAIDNAREAKAKPDEL